MKAFALSLLSDLLGSRLENFSDAEIEGNIVHTPHRVEFCEKVAYEIARQVAVEDFFSEMRWGSSLSAVGHGISPILRSEL